MKKSFAARRVPRRIGGDDDEDQSSGLQGATSADSSSSGKSMRIMKL